MRNLLITTAAIALLSSLHAGAQVPAAVPAAAAQATAPARPAPEPMGPAARAALAVATIVGVPALVAGVVRASLLDAETPARR